VQVPNIIKKKFIMYLTGLVRALKILSEHRRPTKMREAPATAPKSCSFAGLRFTKEATSDGREESPYPLNCVGRELAVLAGEMNGFGTVELVGEDKICGGLLGMKQNYFFSYESYGMTHSPETLCSEWNSLLPRDRFIVMTLFALKQRDKTSLLLRIESEYYSIENEINPVNEQNKAACHNLASNENLYRHVNT
jgi:hypothetical protein